MLEDFAGVEYPLWIEGVLDRAVHPQRGRGELPGQPVPLEQADAVLAGAGPTQPQAQLHDLVEDPATTLHTGRIGTVHHDVGVQVAVPGVAHDAHQHVVCGGDRDDAVQRLGESGHRHRDVVDDHAAL